MNDLRKLIECSQRELAELERQLEPLLMAVQRKRREVELLQQAHSVRTGGLDLVADSRVVETAIGIMREVGRPLSLKELSDGFRRRGLSIPGKGNTTNLLSYLRRSDEISRFGRGIYGLTDWANGGA